MSKLKLGALACIVCLVLVLCGCSGSIAQSSSNVTSALSSDVSSTENGIITLDNIPPHTDSPYVVLNNNQPSFTEDELVTKSYETYSELDSLNRCGVTEACVGKDIMPTEERGSIGQVKPSGWHTVKYDIVDGKYLYNRCHLIGYQLTGENANTANLITGTRYLNVEGMLPFENMVADYVKETGNHVIYRVTPIFKGDNLLASGVQMEAFSVEDNGDGICFNVYCYNVQPGITIDYATGESQLAGETITSSSSSYSSNNSSAQAVKYILNTSSKKIHSPSCSSVGKISEANKSEFIGSDTQSLLDDGYTYCGNCFK